VAGGQESYALPAEPALAEVAEAVRDTGHWAWIVDRHWELAYVTDDLRYSFGGGELVHQADADALGLDPDRLTYTALQDLDTATDKARRDAPAIPVCDV
jgi:hypothetical protein